MTSTDVATPATTRPSSLTRQDLIACGDGTLWPDMPKLPRALMLMFDRIPEIKAEGGEFGKGFVRAELDIKPPLWFFGMHFKDDPVMPGCLGLDALWQLLGFYIGWSGATGKGRALEVGSVKFAGEVLPTAELVTYRVEVLRLLKGRGTRPWTAIGNGYVDCDGKTIYTAIDLKVGVFPKQ